MLDSCRFQGTKQAFIAAGSSSKFVFNFSNNHCSPIVRLLLWFKFWFYFWIPAYIPQDSFMTRLSTVQYVWYLIPCIHFCKITSSTILQLEHIFPMEDFYLTFGYLHTSLCIHFCKLMHPMIAFKDLLQFTIGSKSRRTCASIDGYYNLNENEKSKIGKQLQKIYSLKFTTSGRTGTYFPYWMFTT